MGNAWYVARNGENTWYQEGFVSPDKDAFVSVLGPPVPPSVARTLRQWESGRISAAQLLDEVVPRA